MKLNEDIVLSLPNTPLLLVPYAHNHVPCYHAWMQSTELLELTASEPLSLSEEQENMQSWRNDPTKITFVILDSSFNPPIMAGDVNLYLLPDEDEDEEQGLAEIEVMIAEQNSRRKGLAKNALWLMMAFVTLHLPVRTFVAKILNHNLPSISLFTKQMPFSEHRRIDAFKEIHYRLHVSTDINSALKQVRDKWIVQSFSKSPFKDAVYSPPSA